jgi:hypothetical protein
MMRSYTLSFGASIGYAHPQPDRTAYRESTAGLNSASYGDRTYRVWSNRAAMARSIRMQERREPRMGDWRPIVKLSDGEGY